jgi:hypothetical protein
MSYLSGPRLIFAGRFQADVSTINNDHDNFNTATFTPNQQNPGSGLGEWNPRGTGVFRLITCSVAGATYGDGTSAAGDPVLGLSLLDGTPRPPGKLVDLDTDQQGCSQIWGWRLHLGKPGETPVFTGDFEVSAFSDLWARVQGNVNGDGRFGAFWQSVLTGVTWNDPGTSRLLRELRAATGGGMLSIRFNTDGYKDDSTDPWFTSGRIVGAIGPALANEPHGFIRGRQCAPLNQQQPTVGWFPAIIDKARGKLVADFGNALKTDGVGGPPVAVPGLQLGYLATPSGFTPVGPVTIGDDQWYASTAGICEVPSGRSLSAAELAAMAASPIAAAVPNGQGGWTVLSQEGSDGVHVRADGFVFRMSPGDTVAVTIWASQFGEALPDAEIQLSSAPLADPTTGPSATALSVQSSVKTNGNGVARATLTGTDPGIPRGFIDGQVYAVSYGVVSAENATVPYQDPFDFISVLLWSGYEVPQTPTWWGDVYPILLQYADLYPVMKPILDLSDYHSVVRAKRGLQQALSLSPSDPNYMPVTRDLSPAKRQTILKWIAPATPAEGTKPAPQALAALGESGKARALRKITMRKA